MNENPRSLDMAQELDSESGAEMSALDKAGHIGDDIAFFVRRFAYGDDSEIRFKGGEGVVGDFGFGCGDAGDQRGLACVGVADQTHVRKQLQFETVVAFFAEAPGLGLAWSLVRGGGEVLVAATSATTF